MTELVKTADYEGPCRRESSPDERAAWERMHNGNGVSRRFLNWIGGIVAAAFVSVLGYFGYLVMQNSSKVPVLEERLTNHISGIDKRLKGVEDGVDFLVKREMDRSRGKDK